MSFRDSNNLEAQPSEWRPRNESVGGYIDDPEFERFATELSDKLFSLTSNITNISGQMGKLGTKRETERVRERVQELLEETSSGFKDVGEGLKRVQAWQDLGPSQRYTQGKLNQEFKASLSEYQVLQRRAIEQQRKSAMAARAALEDGGAGSDGLSEQDRQQQRQTQEQEQLRLADQSEVEFQESLIIERENEIRNIEQSVGELNELFRDVAHMVHEQGQTLDIISENVTNVRDDTRGADLELRTASRHQRNARNKMCCLLVILAIILIVVILAAVLG